MGIGRTRQALRAGRLGVALGQRPHGTKHREHVEVLPALLDLVSIDELKTTFNEDVGLPRLILILSPT